MNTTSLSTYYSVKAVSAKTVLSTSPPAEPFQLGMEFGRGINALTGEIRRNPVDTSKTSTAAAATGQEGETFRFKQFSSARDVENSIALNFQSSISIPVDGLTVSATRGLDFSSSTKKESVSLFYLIHWAKNGASKALPEKPTLYEDAQKLLDANKFVEFRQNYGDYYVHQITTRSRFAALWRCTADSETDLTSFQNSLNAAVKAPGDVSATLKFEAALKKSATDNKVALEVQFDTLGKADSVEFKTDDVAKTLDSFREKVAEVNDQVILRHNSSFKTGFPTDIDMEPDLYLRLLNVFSSLNFCVFLNGITPGTSTSRLTRRNTMSSIYTTIYSQRKLLESTTKDAREKAWKKMQPTLDAVSAIRLKLLQLVDRQEIVLKVKSTTVADIKSLFQIDHEDDKGTWVNASQGKRAYRFGQTALDSTRYGIAEDTDSISKTGAIFSVQHGTLDFPGTFKGKGTAVGITVVPNWQDGTGGYWCVPKTNPLGKDAFKVDVKSEAWRGMNWSFFVDYIPDSEYTDMKFDEFKPSD